MHDEERVVEGSSAAPACAVGGAAELDEFEMPSSDGFRLMLAKLKPRLVAAFESLS
jgi:hypothetical protein